MKKNKHKNNEKQKKGFIVPICAFQSLGKRENGEPRIEREAYLFCVCFSREVQPRHSCAMVNDLPFFLFLFYPFFALSVFFSLTLSYLFLLFLFVLPFIYLFFYTCVNINRRHEFRPRVSGDVPPLPFLRIIRPSLVREKAETTPEGPFEWPIRDGLWSSRVINHLSDATARDTTHTKVSARIYTRFAYIF